MGKSSDKTTLGDRLKQIEQKFEIYLNKNKYIVIRLDGHDFSKYTKELQKPFDKEFTEAMINVTKELLKEFQAKIAYTQSDEITLIIEPIISKNGDVYTQIYNGRVQKLASLTAGFTSAKFNKIYTNKNNNRVPYFDARVYEATEKDAYLSIVWRCRDAIKNSKNVFAQTYCRKKDLFNKTSQEQIEYCLETTGRDWNDLDDIYKYGVTVFKEKVWIEKDSNNPLVKPAWRNIIKTEAKDWTKGNI